MILSDFIEKTIDNRGKNPSKYYESEKYPVIDNVLIKNKIYPNLSEVNRYIDQETFDSFLRGYVHRGMPLMTLVGNGIGNVTLAPSDDVAIIQNTIGFQVKENLDEKYLYYYLLSNNERIRNFDRGSGQPSIRKTDILGMEVDFPDIDIQKNISKFLYLLDLKIEQNENINKNLAEQIHALTDDMLSNPSSDWAEISLDTIATFISGYSYKGKELTDSNIAMATIKNFNRTGGFKLSGYKEIIPSDKLKATQHANLFDLLVAHTDLTQNAEVIGNAEMVISTSGYSDIVFSMDLVKVLPKQGISKFLLAALLQDKRFKAHCLGYVNGTTVLHLSKKALPEYSLLLPSDLSELQELDQVITSMYSTIANNIKENTELTNLRDSLLPRIMSGEIDVSNINI